MSASKSTGRQIRVLSSYYDYEPDCSNDLPDISGHWCNGCGYATFVGNKSVCPFTYGSYMRIPYTILEPNYDMQTADDMRAAYEIYERYYK